MTEHNGDRSLGSVAVVVAAAGRGERFGGSSPKALEVIAGRTLLEHCLEVIAELPGVGAIVVAAPPTHIDEVAFISSQVMSGDVTVVPGGDTRPESVANALAVLPDAIDVVLVHDAARAFTPVEQFRAVIDAVRAGSRAVVPGIPLVDTVKEVDGDNDVVQTIPRDALRGVQTPQGFDRAVLTAVHSDSRFATATDDAGMVEASGGTVRVVPGHSEAFKVTRPFDRVVAEALVRSRTNAP